MSINAFNIVTEFRFDIASAVADSKTLQAQAGKISDAANQALSSLKNMGMGLMWQIGAFSGIYGIVSSAVKASEKFESSQRKLANIFLSNKELFGKGGLEFAQAMKMSEDIMDNIRKKGLEFALDPQELFNQVSSIAPMLISHGLDNAKLEKSTDISRGLLKSAPTLGIDPSMIQGQLINLVMGRAGLENTLFQRLMSETSAFRDNKITSSKSYNSLGNEKRIELLRTALLQFGSDADVIAGNINSLTGQMNVLRSQVVGMYSVFKPIGDAIKKPLIQIINFINDWLKVHGEAISKKVADIMKRIIEDPVKFFVMLKQMAGLQGDLQKSGKLAFIIELVHVLGVFLAWLKVFSAGLHARLFMILRSFGTFMMGVVAMIPWAKVFSVLLFALRAAFVVIVRTLMPLLFFMQILTATGAKLKVIFYDWLAKNATRIADVMHRLGLAISRIALPIREAISGMSDLLAGLLGWFVTKEWLLGLMESLATALEWVAKGIVGMLASISALGAIIGQFIGDVMDMRFKGMGGRLKSAASEGFDDYWNKIYGTDKTSVDGKEVAKNVTNIGNVNINQQFKEQLEPDRIAFAVTEQFKKIASNPVQAISAINGKTMRY